MANDRSRNRRSDIGGWPVVSEEPYGWELPDSTMMSRSQRRLHAGTYQAAVVPAIAGVKSIPLSDETVTLVGDALSAVVRFDASYGQDLLPFSALLLRSESASSSQIENLTASAKAIAAAELGDTRRRNARIIVGNTRAMEAAVNLADSADVEGILAVHRALLEESAPAIVGSFRQEQVWIGGTRFGPHRADFVAPHHTKVPAAIDDLVAFMSREDLPFLPQIAVAHAQFETIHPFPDGNGRTGRALVHSLLKSKEITQRVTVPVSAGLLTNVGSYFAALETYRAGNPEVIVRLMADAMFAAIENGQQLVEEIRDVRESWNDCITVRSDSAVWKIVDILVRQPVIDSLLIQRELSVAAPNVLRAIKKLEDAGVLTELSGSNRNRTWAANDILSALDDFADRAGRRNQPQAKR